MKAREDHLRSGISGKSVFIAYAREDADFAARLAIQLRRHVYSAFDSASRIRSGEGWQDVILDELRNAGHFVFVLPAREGAGKNALAELGATRALRKRKAAVTPVSNRLWISDFARLISDSVVVTASQVPEESPVDALTLNRIAA
ncbi:MAG TPA: toll/interleukin-1 receptor domain-containing protein [Rhizobiaceae bacterium]|nr:toll/interleukin-1 receptor domain-containing protein [Rhizobiaceae bacterium]